MAFGTEEWLKKLNQGDDVACNFGSYGRPSYRILTVLRTTPTGIVKCIHECDTTKIYEFDKKGYERGFKESQYRSRKHIEPLTRAIIEDIERVDYTRNLNSMKLDELPLKYLRKLNAIYEEFKWDKKWEETDHVQNENDV